jgi:hypothetical protein
MTALHVTQNLGKGSTILCGIKRNQTLSGVTDGTAERYINRSFINVGHLADPELCGDCLAWHHELPAAVMPALFSI